MGDKPGESYEGTIGKDSGAESNSGNNINGDSAVLQSP